MRLRNAPLVHVLAQVAFSPVLNWTEHVPALQDRLIDLGFPRVHRGEVTEITFGVTPGGANEPAQQTTPQFAFLDRDQRTAFVLSAGTFVLHTSDYKSVEPFLACLRDGLGALSATMKVRLVERLGLRYIDLVQPTGNEGYAEYVDAGLLGYPFRSAPGSPPAIGATQVTFATQSVARTTEGVLAIRSGVLPPGQYLPPDLHPVSLQRPPNIDPARPGLIVDFDHFTVFNTPGERVMDFDAGTIVSHMEKLHATLRVAFRAIITPYAEARWGPEEAV